MWSLSESPFPPQSSSLKLSKTTIHLYWNIVETHAKLSSNPLKTFLRHPCNQVWTSCKTCFWLFLIFFPCIDGLKFGRIQLCETFLEWFNLMLLWSYLLLLIILHSVVINEYSSEAPKGHCWVCVVGWWARMCKVITVSNPTSVEVEVVLCFIVFGVVTLLDCCDLWCLINILVIDT